MVTFVHITPSKNAAHIRRCGLRANKDRGGVYAFPVIESHTLSHQWTRELMKWSRQPMSGVYFRVGDEERVLFGHYNQPRVALSAARAVAAVRAAADPRGFQVILPDSIAPSAITRIAPVRGVIGWRHFPSAHGRKPCGCPACNGRGEPGSAKIRAAWRAENG